MYGIGLSVVASFKVRMDGRAGGLISTAMRATDILMDRVYQLEMDLFERSSGSLFIPITQVVSQKQDAYAPHPEIQRQASLIRTDMDHFTDLEVSTLVQHGYCVARQRCCRVTGLGPTPQSTGETWNPVQVPAKGAGSESGAVVSSSTMRQRHWQQRNGSKSKRHAMSSALYWQSRIGPRTSGYPCS